MPVPWRLLVVLQDDGVHASTHSLSGHVDCHESTARAVQESNNSGAGTATPAAGYTGLGQHDGYSSVLGSSSGSGTGTGIQQTSSNESYSSPAQAIGLPSPPVSSSYACLPGSGCYELMCAAEAHAALAIAALTDPNATGSPGVSSSRGDPATISDAQYLQMLQKSGLRAWAITALMYVSDLCLEN